MRFHANPPHRPGWQSYVLGPLARWLSGPGPVPDWRAPVPVVALTVPHRAARGLAEGGMLLAGLLPGAHVVMAGRDAAPRRIDARHDRPEQVGAAALQVAVFAPVWQGADPVRAAQAAVQAGARALVVTTPGLACDRRLWLADGAGFGNARPWPAGPLDVALTPAAADALLYTGDTAPAPWPPGLPAFAARLRPVPTGMAWPGLRVLAFAADPTLFAALRAQGAHVVAARRLDRPGHALLTRLALEARALGAQLVTSEAEALFLPQSLRPQVLTLPLRLEPADPGALAAWLRGDSQGQG